MLHGGLALWLPEFGNRKKNSSAGALTKSEKQGVPADTPGNSVAWRAHQGRPELEDLPHHEPEEAFPHQS